MKSSTKPKRVNKIDFLYAQFDLSVLVLSMKVKKFLLID